MTLLVLLPLCVVALTATGLWQQERLHRTVAEEYDEVRRLQPIDRNLSIALLSLELDDRSKQSAARRHLEEAETGLVRYLGVQYDSVASADHQASESGHALSLLAELQGVLSADGRGTPLTEMRPRIAQLQQQLAVLHADADSGVQAAHEAARLARDRTISLVIGASLVSAAICISLIVWSTRSINRRLRDLHRRLVAHTPEAGAAPIGMSGVVSQIEELNSQMLQKIEEKGRELLRRERLVGIGLLAADVAHEINNPMNAMLGLSELGLRTVERGPVDDAARVELQESLRVVRREAMRCKGIIERLMAMVRPDRKPAWFDATQLVRETVQVAQAARPDRAGCFVVTGENLSVRAFGPSNDVRQILLNLLINAADAVPPEGRIEADATQTDQEVWLRVRDNGRGFTEDVRQNFFVPFQSFSAVGKGVGLGLSIAQALAEGMGASLRPFSDGPGSGSMFVLAIPVPEGSS